MHLELNICFIVDINLLSFARGHHIHFYRCSLFKFEKCKLFPEHMDSINIWLIDYGSLPWHCIWHWLRYTSGKSQPIAEHLRYSQFPYQENCNWLHVITHNTIRTYVAWSASYYSQRLWRYRSTAIPNLLGQIGGHHHDGHHIPWLHHLGD